MKDVSYFLIKINMETSLFLAQFMGIVFVVIGFAVLVNMKSMKKIVESLMTNPALLYISGFFILVLGLLVVMNHNVWEGGWRVLVTVLGWMTLVKGVLFLVFPEWVKARKSMCTSGWMTFSGIACLAIGVYLLYVVYLV